MPWIQLMLWLQNAVNTDVERHRGGGGNGAFLVVETAEVRRIMGQRPRGVESLFSQ